MITQNKYSSWANSSQQSSQVWVLSPSMFHRRRLPIKSSKCLWCWAINNWCFIQLLCGIWIFNPTIKISYLVSILILEYPFVLNIVLHYLPTLIGALEFHSMNVPTIMIQPQSFHHIMLPPVVTNPWEFVWSTSALEKLQNKDDCVVYFIGGNNLPTF